MHVLIYFVSKMIHKMNSKCKQVGFE